jgi:hypothetical protein
MRSRPFFALLVSSLFVALTVTVAGLGAGKRVEGLALGSSVSDPEGDVEPLRLLVPFPDLGRDLTVEGNTATVLVPTWLLGDPQSFDWVAAVLRPEQQIVTDAAPKGGAQAWTAGHLSEVVDFLNPALLPYLDLTYARVRSVGSSHIEFRWRCRDNIPSDESDLAYMMILSTAYRIALLCPDQAWGWFADRPSGLGFDWDSRPYEDILGAAVTRGGDGQLTFEMTTAQDIPAVPFDEDGSPWFTWILDMDRDQASGGPNDVNVVVRWNPESDEWEGALRGWNGERYEDLQATVVFTRTGATVSAVADLADPGLIGSFLWRAQTSVTVGVDEEMFIGVADSAPDAEWAEEAGPVSSPTPTISPTLEPTATPTETPPGAKRIYLPLITRGVAF